MTNRWENNGNSDRFYFWVSKSKSLQMVTAAMKLKDACFSGEKAMRNLDSILKSRDITLPTDVWIIKAMVFSSSHICMWELDHKECWAPKNGCFWIVVLEKSLQSPLDCKDIKSVDSKGHQSWIFIGGTDAEAEAPLANWCEEQTHWKRPCCWERLKTGGARYARG